MKKHENDSITIFYYDSYETDPKEKYTQRLEENDNPEQEFEDLPSETDDIEDFFVYQNNKTRFIEHYY